MRSLCPTPCRRRSRRSSSTSGGPGVAWIDAPAKLTVAAGTTASVRVVVVDGEAGLGSVPGDTGRGWGRTRPAVADGPPGCPLARQVADPAEPVAPVAPVAPVEPMATVLAIPAMSGAPAWLGGPVPSRPGTYVLVASVERSVAGRPRGGPRQGGRRPSPWRSSPRRSSRRRAAETGARHPGRARSRRVHRAPTWPRWGRRNPGRLPFVPRRARAAARPPTSSGRPRSATSGCSSRRKGQPPGTTIVRGVRPLLPATSSCPPRAGRAGAIEYFTVLNFLDPRHATRCRRDPPRGPRRRLCRHVGDRGRDGSPAQRLLRPPPRVVRFGAKVFPIDQDRTP